MLKGYTLECSPESRAFRGMSAATGVSEKAIDGRYAEADSLGLRAEIAFDRTGTKCLTATTCKACASSPGGQGKRNFGPIGPPYGSIIRAWNRCGMASENLGVNQ